MIYLVKIKLTLGAAKLAAAPTPSVLNNMDPIMVPNPISDPAKNTDIVFVKNSGNLKKIWSIHFSN